MESLKGLSFLSHFLKKRDKNLTTLSTSEYTLMLVVGDFPRVERNSVLDTTFQFLIFLKKNLNG
jgi:hypothetical protein